MTPLFCKAIKRPDEIKGLVDIVLSMTDEPGLKTKNIEYRIMNDRRFESYLTNLGVRPEVARGSSGTTTYKYTPEGEQNIITLREAGFTTIFPSCFHELGHIANRDKIEKLRLPPTKRAIDSEALAYCFENYAKEKFNELGLPQRFRGVNTLGERKESVLSHIKQPNFHSEIHLHALSTVYSRLDINCETFEEAYKTLKKPLNKQH